MSKNALLIFFLFPAVLLIIAPLIPFPAAQRGGGQHKPEEQKAIPESVAAAITLNGWISSQRNL